MPAQSPLAKSSTQDANREPFAEPISTNDGRPMTVIITRAVRKGSEEVFEATLRAFIPKSLTFPGHLGVFMLRPPPGGREFGAVLQFRSQKVWQSFQRWPQYQMFLAEIEQYLQMPARTKSLSGLETWFTPLGADFLRTPPRWKIAFVTWIAVCISVYVVKSLFSLFDQNWPTFVSLLVSNAVIVAALTGAVMPVLSWLFRRWLSSPRTSTAGNWVTGAAEG
jgi:antibiotic biosynthesis monooxygenase (ABM) superfamily enzyme